MMGLNECILTMMLRLSEDLQRKKCLWLKIINKSYEACKQSQALSKERFAFENKIQLQNNVPNELKIKMPASAHSWIH